MIGFYMIWWNIVLPVLNGLSVVFFLLTWLIYAKSGMKDIQSKCVTHYSFCMGFTHIIFLSIAYDLHARLPVYFCILHGILTGFFIISGFVWMHILSFNTWKTARNKEIQSRNMLWYYVFGYVIPGAWMLFVILIDITRITSIHRCYRFLNLWPLQLSMYGIVILLLVSLFYFIDSQCRLWKMHNDASQSSTLNTIMYRSRLYFKLGATMGITWTLGIIYTSLFGLALFVYVPVLTELYFVITLLLAAEGITFFLLMVIGRKKVLRAVANRTFCGNYICPRSCRTGQDSETEEDDVEVRYNVKNETVSPKNHDENGTKPSVIL